VEPLSDQGKSSGGGHFDDGGLTIGQNAVTCLLVLEIGILDGKGNAPAPSVAKNASTLPSPPSATGKQRHSAVG